MITLESTKQEDRTGLMPQAAMRDGVEPGTANPSLYAGAVDDTLYLIGRPTLQQFVRFARRQAVEPPPTAELTRLWNEANAHLRTLETLEAGAADNVPTAKMDIDKYESLFKEFLADPLIRNGFNTVPTEVAFVELDRLVVTQHHIDLTHVAQLMRVLGEKPSDERIFRAALLHDHARAPVKWSRLHKDSYVFVSPSNDVRFLGAMKLTGANIRDYAPPGNVAGIIGLAVGHGSNFLNGYEMHGRIVLNNGYHRAYALRSAGILRAPCIIQHISTDDELELVAGADLIDNKEYYLKHPRPSMFRDFFNPKLFTIMKTHRRLKQVVVRFEVDEGYIPAI